MLFCSHCNPRRYFWFSLLGVRLDYISPSPSPPALNLSQHRGLFKCVSSSHQVAKILEFQLQHQTFQQTPRTDLLSLRIFIFRLICEIHLQVIFLLDCRHFRHTRPCTYGDLWYTYVLLASNQCFCSISSFL